MDRKNAAETPLDRKLRVFEDAHKRSKRRAREKAGGQNRARLAERARSFGISDHDVEADLAETAGLRKLASELDAVAREAFRPGSGAVADERARRLITEARRLLAEGEKDN